LVAWRVLQGAGDPVVVRAADQRRGFGIHPGRLYVTFFAGDSDAPRDDEAWARWQELFREAGVDAAEGDPREGWQSGRLFAYGKNENWWGPVGETGPCGPDSEMFIDTGKEHDDRFGPVCHPACGCGRFVEIGNDVFLQFDRRADGTFAPLAQRNVDTGMGLERLAQVLLGVDSVYETEAFRPLIRWLEQASSRPYDSDRRSFRIVADHVRAAAVIAADGVSASNVHRGYVLRRLIRRAVRYGRSIGLPGPSVLRPRSGWSSSAGTSIRSFASSVSTSPANSRSRRSASG
jgi:alanyl-tRNA synthetase